MKFVPVSTPKPKQVIGMTDLVDFPDLDLVDIKAKVDTGAYTSALHCKDVRLIKSGLQVKLSFLVPGQTGVAEKKVYSADFKQRLIKNSFGIAEKRYVIKTRIKLFGRIIKAEFTLADRERMKNPVLLGRKLLRNRFIVDVSQQNLSYEQKKDKQSALRTENRDPLLNI